MLGRRAAAAARDCASRGSEAQRNWRRFIEGSTGYGFTISKCARALWQPACHPTAMSDIRALAAPQAHALLEAFTYDPGPLGDEQVEIEVQYCGICHSDLSMLNNEWQMTQYPFVPGHEAIGTVSAIGRSAKLVSPGQTVGLGWNAGSCMACPPCLAGDQNMCRSLEMTIVGRHGAFATRVRCHWSWATPIPQGVDAAVAGPLLCGGITVFNPLVQHNVRPTNRVGVIGIGGLGHLALQFLNKWGCDVTALPVRRARPKRRAGWARIAWWTRTPPRNWQRWPARSISSSPRGLSTSTGCSTSTRWVPKGTCTWWGLLRRPWRSRYSPCSSRSARWADLPPARRARWPPCWNSARAMASAR